MTYEIGKLSPYKRHWLTKTSNIPVRFWGFEPSDIIRDKGSFPDVITHWVQDATDGKLIKNPGDLGNTGVGLLFDGAPGMGKTTHAVTALSEFIRSLPDDEEEARKILHMSSSDFGMKARPVHYTTMTDLIWKKKAAWDAEGEERSRLISEMEGFHGRSSDDRMNVRVLVIDDLGKEYGSNYDTFSFDEVLRARYDQGFPTVITTNVPRAAWAARYGEAMGSFVHEAFRQVKLSGDDLRKK
jgi:DNA replication protein DnaC